MQEKIVVFTGQGKSMDKFTTQKIVLEFANGND